MSEVEHLKQAVLAFNGWHTDDAEAKVDALIAAARAEERKRIVEATEFWRDSVYPEGMTAEDVVNELADWNKFMTNGAIVFCHATHGRISKINTDPSVVCSVIDDVTNDDINKFCDEARAEALEDAEMAIHNHEEEFNRQFLAMRSKAPDMVTDNHGWQCKYAGRCEAFGEARNAIEALKEKKP